MGQGLKEGPRAALQSAQASSTTFAFQFYCTTRISCFGVNFTIDCS